MTDLLALHAELVAMSDPMYGVMREFRWCQAQCDALETETLQSGAMPGEFEIRLMFRGNWPSMRLTPLLL